MGDMDAGAEAVAGGRAPPRLGLLQRGRGHTEHVSSYVGRTLDPAHDTGIESKLLHSECLLKKTTALPAISMAYYRL